MNSLLYWGKELSLMVLVFFVSCLLFESYDEDTNGTTTRTFTKETLKYTL